jgi:Spy/CpxP family protein refolding chaperone
MKIKLLPLVAGIATLSIVAAPFILNAQKSNAFPPEGPPGLSQLNLTPEQQSKLDQMRDNVDSQIEGILTPEQQQHFRKTRELREQLRQEMEALNLTADQKKQMHSIMEANRGQMDGILTDAQKAQLRQERQSHMGEHGGGRRNQAPQ